MVICDARSNIDLIGKCVNLIINFGLLFLDVGQFFNLFLCEVILYLDLSVQIGDHQLQLLGFLVLLLLESLKSLLFLIQVARYLFISLLELIKILLNISNLIVKLLNFNLILLLIAFDFSDKLLHNCVFSLVHLILESLGLLFDLVILQRDSIQILRNPNGRVHLRFIGNVQKLCLSFITVLSEITLGALDLP